MISVPLARRLTASLVAAAATAIVAHIATLFVFFVGNGFDSSVIGIANGFFGFSSVFAFLLLAVGFVLTEPARWYITLLVAVLASVLGVFLGSLVGALAAGTPFSADLAGGVVASYGGVNLTLLLALVLTAMTLGRAVFGRVFDSRPLRLRGRRVALVRLPARNLADGLVTHVERTPIDSDLADTQWAAYVDALKDNGWTIVEVPEAADLADSVFVEDTVVVAGDLAVLTRSGAEGRRDELAGVETTVRGLGLSIARIEEPGTLDGGDVLQVDDTVYVGRGGRTNAEGVRQLRELLRPLGKSVVAVPVSGALHLKSAVTALPDGTVLGHGPFVDPRAFPRYLAMPEPDGAHIVVLGDDTVLIAASAPASAELLESLGYRVVRVDVSEFVKLEACVTCLSVRIS